ncbi:EAL domain-containing protein [Trinickia acidisoli]|uniref:EAL domain-containing protein n=1 Tax=Trinickia acidisoli TaxID=2767482 RepID=UPI001A8E9414|nr:EAL domain-containing protein [Trinickia acidisoli]
MHTLRAQPSPADLASSTWLEVGEETEWWVRSGVAPDITLCSSFQPIFSLRSGNVAGTEALLRAYLNDGAQISPPAMFAQRSMDEAVSLDQRCHRTHLHNAASVLCSGEQLFLNFRPETLLVAGYASELVQTVKRASLAPGQVVIEVVEAGGSLHQLADAVVEFRNSGFQIALDDFGVGLSNIDRLVQLQPDVVKLDRSLLTFAMRNSRAAAVFLKLVALLREAGSAVVVEGVETQADLDFAAMVEADMVQGFYLARPASLRMPYGHASTVIDNVWFVARSFRRARRRNMEESKIVRDGAACQ